MQSVQVQLLHASLHDAHWHWAWLQVGQLQSAHSHIAQESAQFAQEQVVHSS
ncbi:hypothetical protein [Haloechinothrix salitolerans]|uniref:hypothetical protein n=1 Tax=Haloechinothrix salitolerans TaxID=926830 RepID=UPI0031EE722F